MIKAPKLAPTTIATLWRFVPESDLAESTTNISYQSAIEVEIQQTTEKIMWNTPFRASGGKDRGSGMTAEQLFPPFGPHIKGLPTILQVTEENIFRKLTNTNMFGKPCIRRWKKLAHLKVLAEIFGKEPLRLLYDRSLHRWSTYIYEYICILYQKKIFHL